MLGQSTCHCSVQHDRFHSEILRQVQERKIQQSIKRQKMAVSRYASKESHSFPAETLEETSEVAEEKRTDGREMTPVQSHLSEKDAKKSEKTRIHQKLKSKKERDDVSDDAVVHRDDQGEARPDEWQGAVLTKSKALRRKPRFLF